MTRMPRKLTALFLALLLVVCVPPPARAASGSETRADQLASLHVFRGTGVDENGDPIYSLDQRPTRLQGLIMLVRLLGLEGLALTCQEACPFDDVTGVFAPLVTFAYINNITNGTSPKTFSPGEALTPRAYLTFLLRALGYTEEAGDFTWGGQTALATQLGMITEQAADTFEGAAMDRSHLVDLSYAALTCLMKPDPQDPEESMTLAEKLAESGVFLYEEGVQAGVLGDDAGWTFDYIPPVSEEPAVTPDPAKTEPAAPVNPEPAGTPEPAKTEPAAPVNPEPAGTPEPAKTEPAPKGPEPASPDAVTHTRKTVSTSQGDVTAHVVTVNTTSPGVTVRTAMVDKTLGHTAPFSEIVGSSGGAVAVINGNFFNSNSAFKTPIGHVMVNGEFLFGNSGLSSLGVTEGGKVMVGRPPLFTRLRSGENQWSIYEINTADQAADASVLYTPAYGSAVTIKSGAVLVARGGVIRDYYPISAETSVPIPSDGFVAFMGSGYTATDYFRYPQIGAAVSMEYYLVRDDEEGFTLEGVKSIVSGAPRLVKDGQIVTTLEAGFQESRFTTLSSPRTAIGVNGEGNLLLVCVPGGAKIQQMRELMLALGCVDAFNLDGGASCGMYYNGDYISTPSRNLTVTLQVFVNG